MDFDNGIDVLRAFALEECKDKVDNVEYITEGLRDKWKGTDRGPTLAGTPKAFVNATKYLSVWPEDESIPAEWGSDIILVIDSLTSLSRAAMNWAKALNPGAREPRQWYDTAQQAVQHILELITSESFQTNVILIGHIDFREQPDGTTRGYAASIGKALGPKIPTFFNTMVLADKKGSGKSIKRQIRTVSTATIDLKSPAPFKIDETLPLETGLKTLFEKLKSN